MKQVIIFLAFGLSSIVFGQNFTLFSNDLGGQASSNEVFNGFGCVGENNSPELHWEHAPKGTESFAITIYDKDAPTGSGWWHWLVFDIPAELMQVKTGAGDVSKHMLPKEVVQSVTDYGKVGYGGPCPPEGHGPHQYVITVYALKTKSLGLDKNASPALVGYYLNSNVIAKASIVMYYER